MDLSRYRLNILRGSVEDVTGSGFDFPRLYRNAGIQSGNADFAGGVGRENPIVRADIRAASVNNLESDAGNRLVRVRRYLANEERGGRLVVEREAVRNAALDSYRLRRVVYRIAVRGFRFGYDKADSGRQSAYGYSSVNGSARARREQSEVASAAFPYGEHRARKPRARHGVLFADGQSRQRLVIEGYALNIVRGDFHSLRVRAQMVAVRSLDFRHDVSGGSELHKRYLTVSVRLIDSVGTGSSAVVGDEFAVGFCDLKFGVRERSMRRGVVFSDD